MYLKNHEQSKPYGLEHLAEWVTADGLESFKMAILLLEKGQGSRSNCLRSVSSDCLARAMLAYFRDNDMANMKQWAYLSAKARIMWVYETLGVFSAEDLLWALISDNEELIDWHCENSLFFESLKDPSLKTLVKTHEFFWLQMHRALAHHWEALANDCERALSQPELFTRELRPRLVIFEFLLALARGDKSTMEERLLERCSPRQRARSFNFESPLSNHFIVSYATLYAKLAWRAGYELELDTPWIPKDWLPVRPLEKYDEPWPFMQCFDIWQPFAEPYAALSPKRPV